MDNRIKIRGGYGIMGNERPIGSANRFNTIGGTQDLQVTISQVVIRV
jgi:hypothetical protein